MDLKQFLLLLLLASSTLADEKKQIKLRRRKPTIPQLNSKLNSTRLLNHSKLRSTLLIPLPASQQKAYHPVMQKGNETYELSRLFVPLGVVGEVVDDGGSTVPRKVEVGSKKEPEKRTEVVRKQQQDDWKAIELTTHAPIQAITKAWNPRPPPKKPHPHPHPPKWHHYLLTPTLSQIFRPSKSPKLDRKWAEIVQRFSEEELSAAKRRVYEVFEGRRGSGGGGAAYEELLNMFQMVFSLGRGKSSEVLRRYDHIGGEKRESGWKGVGGGGRVSFSAGVSYGKGAQKPFEVEKVNEEEEVLQPQPQPQPQPQLVNYISRADKEEPEEDQQPHIPLRLPQKEEQDEEYELIPSTTYLSNPSLYSSPSAIISPPHIDPSTIHQLLPLPSHTPHLTYNNKQNLNSIQKFLLENKQNALEYGRKEEEFTIPSESFDLKYKNNLNRKWDQEVGEETPTTHQQSKVQLPLEQAQVQTYQQSIYKNIFTKPPKPVAKFFAPITIDGEMIRETLRGRYASPVPKYVVELARKLKKDGDVRGIVRVSSRTGGGGGGVEYLYPVRG